MGTDRLGVKRRKYIHRCGQQTGFSEIWGRWRGCHRSPRPLRPICGVKGGAVIPASWGFHLVPINLCGRSTHTHQAFSSAGGSVSRTASGSGSETKRGCRGSVSPAATLPHCTFGVRPAGGGAAPGQATVWGETLEKDGKFQLKRKENMRKLSGKRQNMRNYAGKKCDCAENMRKYAEICDCAEIRGIMRKNTDRIIPPHLPGAS